ncbi:MAG: glycine cleavage system protein H [Desulfobacter sp.]|nr:glycine cleavage system protein H [Desulfobacter sp.]WDP84616.1 MAG: glycine cleavage system protein H [Desulfobacter sp.]
MKSLTPLNTRDCLWMQAGVVASKPCFKDFLCEDCQFNRAMVRVCRKNQAARTKDQPIARKSDKFIFWQEKLNTRPLSQRPCIHYMKNRIDFKTCPRSYRCIDCEFDQFFQDQFKVCARVNQVEFNHVKGFALPAGYYLSPGHTWIKLEEKNRVSLGVDDFAARLLGGFDALSAPLMGQRLTRGRPAFTLGRGRNSVSFTAPISGMITETNPRVQKNPNQIAQAPYTEGWIITLFCPGLKQDLKQLMFMDTARKFMENEAQSLYQFIEERTGLKAADGGTLVNDIYGNLEHITWQELIDTFF